MRIFLVTVNTQIDIYSKANALLSELGIESYEAAEEFYPDGVQDPYRAVDEADAVIWIQGTPLSGELSMGDYNYLYGNTVIERAVRLDKPIFYYHLPVKGSGKPSSTILQGVTRNHLLQSWGELENAMRKDLSDLFREYSL